ncbi:TetR/AcrR family transcriptional regulator [Polyangium aurulentum]|uniref:TetR/AcrR family transcriptional regulator n=1 Tax=Polyangium aurulentum TaxID=2567896 RepID=UPI0010AE2933|nr:TetR/AcrR family transcriptional regulator [Polyangium aurulentum]UQA61795.1 TetR/AcrR family transcriptional regulator [Polyangium aurulentum]
MCPRSAEQFEQIKDERRRALLRAARNVFGRKGFAAAKISEVAAQAGISHGLVYHYFPEKESLFAATVEASAEGWETLVTEARAQAGTPWNRLEYMCRQMIAGLREEPEHLLMTVHVYSEDAAPGVRDVLKRFRLQVLDDLQAMIEEGQRAGEVAKGSPADLTRALIAIIQGLAINRLVEPGTALPALDVVLRILKA